MAIIRMMAGFFDDWQSGQINVLKNCITIAVISFALLSKLFAQDAQSDGAFFTPEHRELLGMVKALNRGFRHKLVYRAAVMSQMLAQANYYCHRLQLPTVYPIQMKDVVECRISDPWLSILTVPDVPFMPITSFGTNIFNPYIPRSQRLHALKIGLNGALETGNFAFAFGKGLMIERLSPNNLSALIGKPSLIDTNGAYQLATQWLAAADVDMAAVEKLKYTVSQSYYQPHGATNAYALPLFAVTFGSKYTPAFGNLRAMDEPLITVGVLGTTKELQEMRFNYNSFLRHVPLITNALDLLCASNPPMSQMGSSLSPTNQIKAQ